MAWLEVTVDNFSGGFTDNIIDNNLTRALLNDNFTVTAIGKLKTRPGSLLFDSNHFSVLAQGNPRISACINFNKDTLLLVQEAANLYFTTGTWAALTGPVTGNVVFSQGSASSYISWSDWNNHLFVVDNAFSIPMKIYQDQNNVLQVRNAGLPLIELTGALALANDLSVKFNAHITDITAHKVADTVDLVSISPAYDLQTLITLVTGLLISYAAHRLDSTLVTPVYHQATSAGNGLASVAAPRTLTECLARLDDLKTQYNAHDNDNVAHSTTGNHQTTIIRFPTAAPTGAGNTYIYKFLYYYTYQVGSVIFEDFGPTSLLSVSTTNPIDGSHQVTISNITALTNGSNSGRGNNFDTANVRLRIYRSQNNGVVETQIADIPSSQTSYVDGATDASIVNNVAIYTTGGVVDNDQPHPAKYFHSVNGFGYYAHVKEGSEILKNRVLQTIQNDLGASPGSFFIDLDDEITGMSSVNSRLVVFTKKWAYRIEGFFDDLGRGGMSATRITDAVGCVSNQSCVQTASGLYYAGIDGFYATDAYGVIKLSDQWNDTYKALTSTSTKQLNIVGTYEAQNQRVYWTSKFDDSSADNDKLLVFDLRFGIKPDACFTTWSGSTNFAPTGLTYFNNQIVIGDRRGYLFKFDSTITTDPKIDTTITPTSWGTKTIIWDYKSPHTNLGSSQVRKFVNRIILQAQNITNATIQIIAVNDQRRSYNLLKLIRWQVDVVWGDYDQVWGTTTVLWNLDGFVEAKRRFPATTLRCSYKQIEITNGVGIITKSDLRGNANISATAKTVTLLSAAEKWPLDVVDYLIAFQIDNYVTQYLVTQRNSDTVITYQDNESVSTTNPNSKWELFGARKGEVLELLKYVIEFNPLTDSEQPFQGSSYLGSNQ